MPALIGFIWTAFISVSGTLVAKVLLSLGIGYVTYSGVSASIDWARAAFLSGMGGLPAAAVGLASTMKIGVCVSMILSAVTARMVMRGMSAAGSIKTMQVK